MKDFGLPWIVHWILGWFAGIWFGIVRIVKGHVLGGILYIITAGFFGIGWLIDLITVLLGKQHKPVFMY